MNNVSLRKTYGETLVELGGKHPEIVALEADLGKSTMSILFGQAYPERYFQMGIAEQNMASTAAGLALVGKRPYMSTFAVFASGRPYDQIRSSIAIPNLPVVICGSSAGLSDFGDGKTHQSIDDIGIMRILPHMTVLCPCDAVETKKMMIASLKSEGSVYIRICRADLPVLLDDKDEYHIGKMTQMRDGKDVVIFATGVMVGKSLEAAALLEQEGIRARVVNISTIKPLDTASLKKYCNGMKGVVTAEEHNIYCGLGSAVAEALSASRLPIGMVAIHDSFGTSAKQYEELLTSYGLQPKNIIDKVKEVLSV
jgi:transketolase